MLMPQLLKTIEEYIATDRKEATLFVNFSKPYNQASLGIPFDNNVDEYSGFDWLDKKHVNEQKRQEFLEYMKINFPNIKLVEVFDNVPMSYLVWPFLGTMAIDIDPKSEEAKKICALFEDENEEPLSMDAVIYIMEYEIAQKLHQKREESIDAEFGE